jgi:glucokinase
MNSRKIFAGVDLGGTTIHVGLVTAEGEIITEKIIDSEVAKGPNHVLNKIANVIHGLRMNTKKQLTVCALGIGTAGKIDIHEGILIEASNFPNWRDVPLSTSLNKRLKMPVFVDNDANVAALGEHAYGAGQGASEMFMVTLGTGVGGGLILRGRIYRGADGVAGEFGHTIIQYNGPVCGCGRKGCVEAFVGTKGILRIVQEKLNADRDSLLTRIKPGEITPKDISIAANQGDEVAIESFRDVGTYLGIGLGNVVNLLNIERIVVSGGVAKAGKWILKPTRESLIQTALRVPGETIQVVASTLRDRAGILGAARLAMLGMGVV